MNIRNRKELKTYAARQLSQARDEKRIVAIFSGMIVGLSALMALADYVLGLQIDQSGGLSNMGTRSVLSALQTVLPLVQSVIVTCLGVGYLSTTLRIARGQYASANGLRLGFDRLWVLLRSTILQGLIFAGIGIACLYISTYVFLLTPLSRSAMEILMPLMSDVSILNSGFVLDDATYNQLISAMTPMMLICGVLFCAVAAPVMYGYRMVNYVIIDRPGIGAMAALRESRRMMKYNRVSLFRLDLSLWWYYAALFGATLIGYGDMVLPMLGVELPFSAEVGYYLFYIVYLALYFAAYYFLRNRVEVTYALAYDAVKPEEKKDSGVVLGNIFDM